MVALTAIGEEVAVSNLETVQEIYAAFGRGDIEAIVEKVADDVRWESWEAGNTAQDAGVPDLLPRSGKGGVLEFFGVVGGMQIDDFRVLDFLASERQVVVEVDITLVDGDTRMRDEELHLWTFDDEGKVVRLRHYVDTAKHMAFAGVAVG
jgi:uncharacterized protein